MSSEIGDINSRQVTQPGIAFSCGRVTVALTTNRETQRRLLSSVEVVLGGC